MSKNAPPKSSWETRYVDLQECRAELTDGKTLTGYGIVFNVQSLNLGGFKEIILPSAVDRTLREGLDVRSYVNHDPNKIIGRSSAGTLTMKKDRKGLRVEIFPPSTSYAHDLMESVKRGDISGMSFRFRTITDDWHMEDELLIREVSDMVVGEIGPVSEPAYVDTSVAARSMAEFHESIASGRSRDWYERRLRVAGIR